MASPTVAARVGEVAKTVLATAAEFLAIGTEIAKIITTRADDMLDDISEGLRSVKKAEDEKKP